MPSVFKARFKQDSSIVFGYLSFKTLLKNLIFLKILFYVCVCACVPVEHMYADA